jgi:hypothetical protein
MSNWEEIVKKPIHGKPILVLWHATTYNSFGKIQVMAGKGISNTLIATDKNTAVPYSTVNYNVTASGDTHKQVMFPVSLGDLTMDMVKRFYNNAKDEFRGTYSMKNLPTIETLTLISINYAITDKEYTDCVAHELKFELSFKEKYFSGWAKGDSRGWRGQSWEEALNEREKFWTAILFHNGHEIKRMDISQTKLKIATGEKFEPLDTERLPSEKVILHIYDMMVDTLKKDRASGRSDTIASIRNTYSSFTSAIEIAKNTQKLTSTEDYEIHKAIEPLGKIIDKMERYTE